jgi:hypothetical protein
VIFCRSKSYKQKSFPVKMQKISPLGVIGGMLGIAWLYSVPHRCSVIDSFRDSKNWRALANSRPLIENKPNRFAHIRLFYLNYARWFKVKSFRYRSQKQN